MYIANPPYNCHEVEYLKNNKKRFLKLFSDIGIYNIYELFIFAIIDLAKEGACIGFICSDSYFTNIYYKKLREKILNTCFIYKILICPNNLFNKQKADVRTSIIILQKGKKYQKQIKVLNRCDSIGSFKLCLKNREFVEYNIKDIILNNKLDNLEFLIDCPDDIKILFKNRRIKEFPNLHCIIGISTGNDKLYLSNVKKDNFTVPFYKNPGKDTFYTDKILYLCNNFLELDKKISNFMVRNKELLFKKGITCSSMGVRFSACYLPKNSTYGVNPNIICDENDIWWLLS